MRMRSTPAEQFEDAKPKSSVNWQIERLAGYWAGKPTGATGDIDGGSQTSAHKCIRQVTDGFFRSASQYVIFLMDNLSQTERAVGFHSVAGFPRVVGDTVLPGLPCNAETQSVNQWDLSNGTFVDPYIRGMQDDIGFSTSSQLIGQPSPAIVLLCKRDSQDSGNPSVKGWCDLPVQEEKDITLSMCSWFVTTGRGLCRHVPNSFILCESNIPTALFHAQDTLKGWLLGDKGRPLQMWLMTPVKNPTSDTQKQYNNSHSTTRSVVEQAIGLLKMSFWCLDRSGGALQYSPVRECRIILVCCVLQNIVQQRGLLVDEVPRAPQAAAPFINIEEEDEEDNDVHTIGKTASHLAARHARESLIFDRFS
ncbi:putative nuclease HARBI1 [Heptranchias perlo]|uniref:putative nuclease HARBI1 n=1 Tax=Heptranchias perlo TaxID=212740 RepID=UPI003559CABA